MTNFDFVQKYEIRYFSLHRHFKLYRKVVFFSRNRMKLNLNWIECPEHLLFLVRTCLENRGRAQVSERIHLVVVVVITARF